MSGTGALERVVRRGDAARAQARGRAEPQEQCELCSAPVATQHRHVLDRERGELLCACHPCSVLFDRDEAAQGRYRLVPQRRLALQGVEPAALGVPVGLAFFVVRGDGEVTAHYPSPAGATRWQTDRAAWDQVVRTCPELGDMAPDVEALLVNTARGRSEAWLVPLDDCFRLAGAVRLHWRGLSGGDRVWAEIDRFFEELRRHG